MKKSIIYLLFFFAVCAFSPNIVFAQADIPIKMRIETLNLNFGRVTVGTSKPLWFTIVNYNSTYEHPLLISWNTINQPFSIDPTGPFNVPPMSERVFCITFKPTAAIGYNQTNIIYNNAAKIQDKSTQFPVNSGPMSPEINGVHQLIIHFIGTGVAITTQQTLEKKVIENTLKSVKK